MRALRPSRKLPQGGAGGAVRGGHRPCPICSSPSRSASGVLKLLPDIANECGAIASGGRILLASIVTSGIAQSQALMISPAAGPCPLRMIRGPWITAAPSSGRSPTPKACTHNCSLAWPTRPQARSGRASRRTYARAPNGCRRRPSRSRLDICSCGRLEPRDQLGQIGARSTLPSSKLFC
jgi:hypothetical protein